jgi:transglutaminase-like putative cysteine protease
MIYRIVHRTTCRYRHPVSVGKHVACLRPRSLPYQQLEQSELYIEPTPATMTERIDYFGNLLCFFTVQEPHKELVVEARCEVKMKDETTSWPQDSLPWEEVIGLLANDQSPAGFEAYQFRFESPRIKLRTEFASYALQSFTPKRSMLDGLLDLTERIHNDFRFDSRVTNVRTSTDEVFRKRRGVCQDFAHFQIACLRSLNLSARYVSGYLRTHPPPGQPRLVGADASHAWVSAYCPGIGWVDLDPANNLVPSSGHVTLAWGRDYGDVSPLYGVIQGGGAHTLTVAVDMDELESHKLLLINEKS